MNHTQPPKFYRYAHVQGQQIQANGIDIPPQGIYVKARIEQLDRLVGFSLVRTEEDSLPVDTSKSGTKPAPLTVDTKGSEQAGTLVSTPAPGATPASEIKITEPPYSEIALRKLGIADLRQIGYRHAVSGRGQDAIVAALKAKNLVGP